MTTHVPSRVSKGLTLGPCTHLLLSSPRCEPDAGRGRRPPWCRRLLGTRWRSWSGNCETRRRRARATCRPPPGALPTQVRSREAGRRADSTGFGQAACPGAPSPPALLYSPSALNANVTPRSGREEAGAHSEALPGGHLGPVLVAGTGAPWRPCPTPGSRRTRAASRIPRRRGPWPRAAPVARSPAAAPSPGS